MTTKPKVFSVDKLKELVTQLVGERCPDYDAYCPVCEAWRKYDNLVKDL